MNPWKQLGSALCCLAVLAGCGQSPQSADATAIAALQRQLGGTGGARPLAQATAQAFSPAITADQLMDWAESSFAEVFPDHPDTSRVVGFVYRFYLHSGNYIAVADDGGIYIILPAQGGQPQYLGPLSGFSCRVSMACGPGTVALLAGSIGGRGHVDGVGSAARFVLPYSVAVDAAGTVYVADEGDSTIRKITPQGRVSTLAGSPGIAGAVDGAGTAARFVSPRGLAVDRQGNLWVTDGYAVRKVSPAGVVSTVAGLPSQTGYGDGTGASARFAYPTGIAVDASGNAYVADWQVIRKVTPTGVVTTFVGQTAVPGSVDGPAGAARFQMLLALAMDGAGNLLAVDFQQQLGGAGLVRKITPAGQVSTLAGHLNAGGSQDGQGSGAALWYPRGIACDAAGNVFVSESAGRIRKIAPDATVTTVAGDGLAGAADGPGASARFAQPNGMAADAIGNLYIADQQGSAIRKLSPAGWVSTFAGAAQVYGMADGASAAATFSAAASPAIDGQGNILLVDGTAVRRISPLGVVSTLAGGPDAGNDDGAAPAARFVALSGLTMDASGNAYVAGNNNCMIMVSPAADNSVPCYSNTVRKISPNGTTSTLAGRADGLVVFADGVGAAARFAHPDSLTAAPDGTLFLTDMNAIRRITPQGEVATLGGKWNAAGFTDGLGTQIGFSSPGGIARDAEGNLYIADTYNSTIRKLAPDGRASTLAGTADISGYGDGAGAAARFNRPHALALDGAGNLYVGDVYPGNATAGVVRKITPQGVVTTIAGSNGASGNQTGALPGAFYELTGLTVDAGGTLLVATTRTAVLLIHL
jgi:sugar lactone lactonase YvrE